MVSGMSRLTIFVHSEKALLPIVVRLAGKTISVKLVHPENAKVLIDVIPS
jgi:hypothetical protein